MRRGSSATLRRIAWPAAAALGVLALVDVGTLDWPWWIAALLLAPLLVLAVAVTDGPAQSSHGEAGSGGYVGDVGDGGSGGGGGG